MEDSFLDTFPFIDVGTYFRNVAVHKFNCGVYIRMYPCRGVRRYVDPASPFARDEVLSQLVSVPSNAGFAVSFCVPTAGDFVEGASFKDKSQDENTDNDEGYEGFDNPPRSLLVLVHTIYL